MLNLLREQYELRPSPLVMSSPESELWSVEGLRVCQGSDANFRRTALLLDRAGLEKFLSDLRDVCEILRSCDPQAFDRIQELVRDVVPVCGGGLRSATTPLVFGAVFVNVDAVEQPIDLIALLVHESSHLALHIKAASQKLVSDSRAMMKSPLRLDPRPPIFVLHATYVSAKVADCMLALSDQLTSCARDRAFLLGVEALHDLESGLAALSGSDHLTPQGAELVDGLAEVHRALARRRLPKRTSAS
ncbi:MAG: hypothetical protein HY855_04445 [Burkholderiales bacterium]|nr:hypothetical protein [Burkholderiales bacterium]